MRFFFAFVCPKHFPYSRLWQNQITTDPYWDVVPVNGSVNFQLTKGGCKVNDESDMILYTLSFEYSDFLVPSNRSGQHRQAEQPSAPGS